MAVHIRHLREGGENPAEPRYIKAVGGRAINSTERRGEKAVKKLLNSTARAAAFILHYVRLYRVGDRHRHTLSAGGYSSGAEKARAGTLEGWCISAAENAMAAFVVDRSTKDVTTDSAFATPSMTGNGDEVRSTLDGGRFWK